MKLIIKLGTRINKNGILESWGKFECPFCLQEVEKELWQGNRNKSCGCNQHSEIVGSYKHGGSDTKLYRVWVGIRLRCSDSKSSSYKNYGGRGIIVCPEWTNDYIKFRDWALSNGYTEGLQINRVNNNGNYEPSNCNFITHKENQRNKNNNVINLEQVTEIRELYKTGNYTQKELAEKYNIDSPTISRILSNKIWKN